MYARVVSVQCQLDKLDEGINICRSMEASWQQQKGFQGANLLVDRNTGKVLSISNWENRANLDATETSGWYQEQIAKFAAIFAAPPVREIYEIALQVGLAKELGGA